ncbi:MAG TPA: hypothetical protein PKK67_04855 [Cyclobacteriaceae bacterium]|jgi:hypothetical protein|nr:hypothetical protein [Cytophagales bacterium]HNT49893.1 hypothetical protein [Cyclobacteriaceae bacterium]HRE66415.1 hypothetical protein [Cyclobacteriaceae bacterium]
MKKTLIITCLTVWISAAGLGQTKPADTVVIKVGAGSKLILAVQDKKDLETMKQYNFQKLISDLIIKLENEDTSKHEKPADEYLKTDTVKDETILTETDPDEDWGVDWSNDHKREKKYGKRTYHSMNFDLGTNNYISKNGFPDQDNSPYTVKPWGSWYVGINSVQRTRLANKFYMEWGLGVSWYNFKFENEQIQISKDDNDVIFQPDTRDADFKKSKLTATYLNASLVPMLDFGGNRHKPSFFDGYNSDSFRIGVGPYVGYRIASYSKQMFEENGAERKPRNHDNFYLNNLRYGLRAQIGFNDIDFFFNYDMNELFVENKGPQLNAFSFGVTF